MAAADFHGFAKFQLKVQRTLRSTEPVPAEHYVDLMFSADSCRISDHVQSRSHPRYRRKQFHFPLGGQ